MMQDKSNYNKNDLSLHATSCHTICIIISINCAACGAAQVSKEVKSGQYRLLSYFLAKTAVSVPFESAIAVVFTVIIYNMIGFQAVASKYFIFMVTLVLVNLISEMVGFIGGVITKVRARTRPATLICLSAVRLLWPAACTLPAQKGQFHLPAQIL